MLTRSQGHLPSAVRWAIARGVADPDRVAVVGHSYGGYATLMALAQQPRQFACGIDIAGPVDLASLIESFPPYWEFELNHWYSYVGDPAVKADRERMEQISPINLADRFERPLLVIQGANDPRVNKAESDQIVRALRDLGRRVEYLMAPDEGHGFASEESNQALFAKIEEFLAAHLGGRFQSSMTERVRRRLEALTVDVATV